MSSNEIILGYLNKRLEEEVDISTLGSIDLFFWGDDKDVNLYLDNILTHSALAFHLKDGSFVYKKIIVINADSELEKSLFDKYLNVIDLVFLSTKNYEVKELEDIANANEYAYIIVFNIERYVNLNNDVRAIAALNNRVLNKFEIPYFNVVNNILYMEDKVNNNFILFDSQLYLVELDFLEPLFNVDKLCIQGFSNSLVEGQIKINERLKRMIEEKLIFEAIEYIDNIEPYYNKDFLKLQVYSELTGENNFFYKEIGELFERGQSKT
ncbi:hypothetical protein ACG94X_16055 [Acinetobacter sp. ULE_I010]|uniref:hypothetical protein n=1 Tax=Acinetobacter sp. ULE_I010 TaxID=3373065 RepID=UPI003AF6FA14